jgi:hypothetical protein
MTPELPEMNEESATKEALSIFEREVGATGIEARKSLAGNRTFLKFLVGKDAPLYAHALLETQKSLSPENPFRGVLGLVVKKADQFPGSLEAAALLTLLTRSTRAVAQDASESDFSVPYIPFQNREDHQVAQPASHVILGRRGVGKSTLIRRARELLKTTRALIAVLDMQSYSNLTGDDLAREVLHDLLVSLAESTCKIVQPPGQSVDASTLKDVANRVLRGELSINAAPPASKRAILEITKKLKNSVFVFLDDFHLVDQESQPWLLHLVHGALKGAGGWLKVSGLRSLLNVYSGRTRQGLQIPGDAQPISLDLTLENPEAAETHLQAILSSFLRAVGYSVTGEVISEAAFKRLVWANAGVPRDFLQMFARAVEHAQRNRHVSVTLSDVNVAIGEFGQRKMDDLQQDARNAAGDLQAMLSALESYCLDDNKVNAFLIKSEDSQERKLVQVLSDLRMVHLIHQSITPRKAGERYEAFILDYSIFTGFRRRPGVREMVPEETQFKASELRQLPKVSAGFLSKHNPRTDGSAQAPSRLT